MTGAAGVRSADRTPAFFAAAGATALWVGNLTVGSAVGDQVAPLTLNFLRWAVALAILAPFAARAVVRDAPALARRWLWALALAATGVAGFQTFVYYGVRATEVLNAALIITASPSLILLADAAIAGRRPRPLQALGVVAALVGATALIVEGDWRRLSALDLGVGDLWMAGAAVLWTAYTLILRTHPRDVAPESSLFASVALGVLMLAPFALPEMRAAPPNLTDPTILGAVAYVAVGASIIAFVLWTFAVRRIGPVETGLFLNLMPVWAAMLGFVLLGEGLAAHQLVAAATIALGVVLVNRGG